MTIKRRRRGPNKPKPSAISNPLATDEGACEAVTQEWIENTQPTEVPTLTPADLEPAPIRRRRSTVGEHAMKLSAPSRPGYHRRFFNDDRNRLATAEELGYTPVSDTGLKTSGLGSTVQRLAGTKDSGEPLHTILYETPDELYAEGVAEKEAQCAAIDQAIMSGRDSEGQMSQIPQSEKYGQVSMKRD